MNWNLLFFQNLKTYFKLLNKCINTRYFGFLKLITESSFSFSKKLKFHQIISIFNSEITEKNLNAQKVWKTLVMS